MWPWRKKSSIILLTCQGQGCGNTLEEDLEPNVPDHVKSMKAAVKAHDAGWYAASGPILCPECAGKLKS
jgi:hypothetical protein